jgi:hypothetical protein
MLGTKQALERQKPFLLRKPRFFWRMKVNVILGVVELSCHERARYSLATHAFSGNPSPRAWHGSKIAERFLGKPTAPKLLDKAPSSIVVLIDQDSALCS